MDNLELNPSEYFYALKDVKAAIDTLEDTKILLNSISNLEYDVKSYNNRLEIVNKRLNELYVRLKKVGNEMSKMDPNICALFKHLNYNNNDEFNFEGNDQEIKEEKLDEVKGNNNDLGAKKSKHSFSLLSQQERLLDTLKGGRKGLGGHLTNRALSLLLGGRKK